MGSPLHDRLLELLAEYPQMVLDMWAAAEPDRRELIERGWVVRVNTGDVRIVTADGRDRPRRALETLPRHRRERYVMLLRDALPEELMSHFDRLKELEEKAQAEVDEWTRTSASYGQGKQLGNRGWSRGERAKTATQVADIFD